MASAVEAHRPPHCSPQRGESRIDKSRGNDTVGIMIRQLSVLDGKHVLVSLDPTNKSAGAIVGRTAVEAPSL